jgi:nicotinamidase-related amidase
VSETMALVFVGISAGTAVPSGVGGLAAAFRAAGLPVVHAVDNDTAVAPEVVGPLAGELDTELLRAGGVQTLGPSELAIGLPSVGAFDATPLDALLRGLGVNTVVVGGVSPSPALSASVRAAELRGYRALLATEELAITLGAHLTTAA